MNIKSLTELLNTNYPEQEYIVDRIVPYASLSILSGQSRSLKTYTLLDIALRVASGTPLFDTFSTIQAPVLMIDEENGERLLHKRLKQLGADDNLPVHFMSFNGFHLDKQHIDDVLSFCTEKEIKLIIIDALIRVHSSDENSAKDMSKVFQKLRQFSNAGIAVLVTQHHRKAGANNMGAGNEMRGSSDILAAVDSHIAVSRKEKYYLRFTQEKQRYAEELDPFEVKVSIDDNHCAFEYLGSLGKPQDKSPIVYAAVVKVIDKHGELSTGNLLEKVQAEGISTYKKEFSDMLKRWVAEGALPKPKRPDGNTKLYWLESKSNE